MDRQTKKTLATYTLGCRVNHYETEAVEDLFIKAGYIVKNFDDVADVYVINTCTVTNFGDRKSRQVIRKAKKKNKDAIVVVMGCYAQSKPCEVAKIEGVDIVIGNSDKSKIVDYVRNYKDGTKNLVKDIMNIREFDHLVVTSKHERTRAFVKIQDGCDNFCSYCIIPYVRGRVRSKPFYQVIDEVCDLAKLGYSEVVLTGIHIASYGKDLKDVDLVDLVYEVYKIDGIKRIRFGSVEPNLIGEKFIKMLVDLGDKVCNHFHISLQSGCDATLKRMNRKYTTFEYMKVVELLRKNIKDILITTDVIVGFPEETEEEFCETLNFLKNIKFYKVHVFKYSKREGTAAARFSGQITDDVKEKRSESLLKLSNSNIIEYNRRNLGKVFEVLLEKDLENGYYEGLTNNYMRVLVRSGSKLQKGEIYKVYLEELKDNCIVGRVTEDEGGFL